MWFCAYSLIVDVWPLSCLFSMFSMIMEWPKENKLLGSHYSPRCHNFQVTLELYSDIRQQHCFDILHLENYINKRKIVNTLSIKLEKHYGSSHSQIWSVLLILKVLHWNLNVAEGWHRTGLCFSVRPQTWSMQVRISKWQHKYVTSLWRYLICGFYDPVDVNMVIVWSFP